MKSKLDFLKADVKEVVVAYPELEVYRIKGIPRALEGPLHIRDVNDQERGVFEIRLTVPTEYPQGFPSLRETSKKIPRTKERHIYEDTHDCCVVVRQKQIIEGRKGITLLRFMRDYAEPYFANQIYFEENGKFAEGEYAHGECGQFQFYIETFKSLNVKVILRGIEVARNKTGPERNDPCLCGSGIKYKKCHLSAVQEITVLGPEQLEGDALMILRVAQQLAQIRKAA